MATNQLSIPVINAAGVTIGPGAIVRLATANNSCRLARAIDPANVAGVIGAAQGGAAVGATFNAVVGGDSVVQMMPMLTLTVGESIYVSATNSGIGTNVAPDENAVAIGVIKSTLLYAGQGLVNAVIFSPAAPVTGPTPPAGPAFEDIVVNGTDPVELDASIPVSIVQITGDGVIGNVTLPNGTENQQRKQIALFGCTCADVTSLNVGGRFWAGPRQAGSGANAVTFTLRDAITNNSICNGSVDLIWDEDTTRWCYAGSSAGGGTDELNTFEISFNEDS